MLRTMFVTAFVFFTVQHASAEVAHDGLSLEQISPMTADDIEGVNGGEEIEFSGEKEAISPLTPLSEIESEIESAGESEFKSESENDAVAPEGPFAGEGIEPNHRVRRWYCWYVDGEDELHKGWAKSKAKAKWWARRVCHRNSEFPHSCHFHHCERRWFDH